MTLLTKSGLQGRRVLVILLLLLAAGPLKAQPVKSYDDLLVGTHLVSLHWISLEYFGTVRISRQANGSYRVRGGHRSRTNSDSLAIDGVLLPQSPTELLFTGKITTFVASWGTESCTRLGTLVFRQTGGRKYWRLQPVESPCNMGADYIDIYTRVEKLKS